jgi:hypothetical protein
LNAAGPENHLIGSECSGLIGQNVINNSEFLHDRHVADMDSVTELIHEFFVHGQKSCLKSLDKLQEDIQ